MQQQVVRHRAGILLLTFHTQRQRLDATTHRIAFDRREHASETILSEINLLTEFVILDHHQSGVHFGMSGQILGGGMNHNVSTQIERLLQIRRHERVIDD